MPKNPQNIGSVLRASGNFGVRDVVLVSPRADVREEIVSTVACGSPARLTTVDSLEDALADSSVSLAFSRRKGKGRPALRSLDAFLRGDRGASSGWMTQQGTLALVFGREESGLEAHEIMLCSHTVEIPSEPSFPSLNLSHAVAVILSQLFEYSYASNFVEEGGDRGGEAPATHAELTALFKRVTGMLERQGLDMSESKGGGDSGSHGRRIRAPGHLKSALLKGGLSQAECRSLFGLVKELEKTLEVSEE